MADGLKQKSIYASAPSTTRGMHSCLTGDPKGKNFLYVNGNNVFIRDIENPNIVDVYGDHQFQTTYAKYSPSGYYIASGDVRGNVRIWDTVNPEHIGKYVYETMGGPIRDIAWTEDSKRLLMVGDGSSKFGAAIMVDTGSSSGTVTCDTRGNSCDFRHVRPYRAVVGNDGLKVYFHEAPKVKFLKEMKNHTRYVSCTRFSPNGALFLTAGFDQQCFLYDGKDAEFVRSLGGDQPAHSGGILAASWSGDSRQILTASMDKTAKIWDAETGQEVAKFVLDNGNNWLDHQVACLWQNNYLLSLSASGDINYLDPNDTSKPARIIQGHQKNIVTLAVNKERSKVYSASFDGVTNCWETETGLATSIKGNKPTTMTKLDYNEDHLSVVSPDDTLRTVDVNSLEYMEASCKLGSQPQDVSRAVGNVSVVAGIELLTVVKESGVASSLSVPFKATAVDIHPNQSEVAVGAENGEVHIYTLSGDALTEKKTMQTRTEAITACRYSPDGEYLTVGSATKTIDLYQVQNDYEDMDRGDYKHTSKVTAVAWSPDGCHYASTCGGGEVKIWNKGSKAPLVGKRGVHGKNGIQCVEWLDNSTVITGGADSCIRVSEVKL